MRKPDRQIKDRLLQTHFRPAGKAPDSTVAIIISNGNMTSLKIEAICTFSGYMTAGGDQYDYNNINVKHIGIE
jgi:hypothetical protein